MRAGFLCLGLCAAGNSILAQTVINAGRGGDNSRNLLERFEIAVLSHRPTLVVMLIGTNDALNPRKCVELDEYQKNLETLIKLIKASSAKVLLLCPPPCYAPYLLKRHPTAFLQGKGPNEKLAEIRLVQRSVAASEHVPLVDLSEIFGEESKKNEVASLLRNAANSHSEDGVHPTAAGYRAIAVAVHTAISKGGLPTGVVVCFGDSITYGLYVKGAGSAKGETYPARLAGLLNPAAPGSAPNRDLRR